MITAPAGRVFPPACSGTHFPALKRQGLAAGDPCSLTSGRTGTSFLPARTRPGQRLVLIRFTPIICAFPPFVNPPTFLKESRQRTFPSRGFLVPDLSWAAAIGHFFFWVSLYSTLFPERIQAKNFSFAGFFWCQGFPGRPRLVISSFGFPFILRFFPERTQAKDFSFAGFSGSRSFLGGRDWLFLFSERKKGRHLCASPG